MYAFPGTSPCSNHMQRLARGLIAEGHAPLIVAPSAPGGPTEGTDAFGVPFRAFNMPAKPRLVPYYPHWVAAMRKRMLAAVQSELEKTPFDAVILMGESGCVFNPIRKLAQKHRVPALGYPMEWFAPTVAGVLGFSWFDQWLHRFLTYPRCNGIIGISRQWTEFSRARKIPSVVVPSFSKYADDALPPVISHEPGKFRIVFVGRWFRRELPPTLFEALDLAIDRGVDFEVVVIGSAGKANSMSQALEERPSLRQLALHPRVRDRIRFNGFMVGQALIDEMGQADAFVILREDNLETCSLFPTRLPEFLSTGKPVIVSDAGDLALYLNDRESACVIPPGDRPKELADAICFLAANPLEAKRIGEGGRDALARHFSQRVLAKRVADFVRGLHAAR